MLEEYSLMIRNEQIKLSLATIHKALTRLEVPLVRTKRFCYEMNLPSKRTQMDVTKN